MSKNVKKKKSRAEKIYGLFKVQIAFMLIVVAIVAYYYVGGYASKVSDMKDEAVALVRQSTTDTFRQTETSIVYDANGNTISTLKGEKDVYYLSYDEIPTYVTQALISIEDKKFYKHEGVDYKAIVRAAYAAVRDGEVTQGGSTITQQLARTIFLSNEKTWERKVEEIYIAYELEKKYSKEQILEFYLNNVYFANGYYGIEAAAQGYFSKDVNELTLSEICFLIAIPNSPSYYDPVANPVNTITRRNTILKAMYDDGVISEKSYENASAEQIALNRANKLKNDSVETYTYNCATKILMALDGFEFKTKFSTDVGKEAYEKDYEEAYNKCNASLFTAGYRIYTSIDLNMQQSLQSAIDEGLAEYTDVNDEGIYELQSAGVCIDNETGMVKAIVGGRSQDVNGYTLNRAFQSYRQPGSAIKPLIVYTPALERGYTPDTIVVDEKIEDGPDNATGTYSGEITLREAVMYSKNVIAWKLYEELTPEVGIQYLINMGFSKIEDEDYGMAASLGGLTVGVSPLEMAKAYATIENDGLMRDPTCITKITDAKGNVIYEAEPKESRIYEENASRMMTDMLQSVVTDGTARGIDMGDMPAAGKTGTTNNNRDGWFCGYTGYYTTSIWVGYDIPKQMPGLTGASYPAKIWESFMNTIHEGLTPKAFKAPIIVEETEGELDENTDGETEENLDGEAAPDEQEQPVTRVTQTFEGTEVPEGAIPEGATDITITTTVE